MAVLVALVMCLVCIGFVTTTSIDVTADTGTVVNSTAQTAVVNTEATFTIKEAHCDAIFGTSAAMNIAINTPTTVTTAFTSAAAVTQSGLKSQTPATGNTAALCATIKEVQGDVICPITATAIIVNNNYAPVTTGGNCFGTWLATASFMVS